MFTEAFYLKWQILRKISIPSDIELIISGMFRQCNILLQKKVNANVSEEYNLSKK